MQIMIDTSVIIAVIANEPSREKLIEATFGAELLAPMSVHWEIGNAFSAMLKRGRISLEQVLSALEVYRSISLRLVDVEPVESIRIADRLNIYAYDAYLIRAAEKYRVPLLSLDKGLLAAAERYHIPILKV